MNCSVCGSTEWKELRPYGVGGDSVCRECAFDPTRVEETEAQYRRLEENLRRLGGRLDQDHCVCGGPLDEAKHAWCEAGGGG